MAARHLSFYSSGDNSPIDSNPLVPCAAGIRYIPKVQRPVLPPNLFDCPCRLGDSCSDIWCLYAGWNFGVRPCASVNISRVWGRHAPTRSLGKLARVWKVKSRMDRKFSRIENLWPRDGSCPLLLRSKRFINKCFRIVKAWKISRRDSAHVC